MDLRRERSGRRRVEAGAVIQLKGRKAPKAGQETKGRVTSSKYAAPGIR